MTPRELSMPEPVTLAIDIGGSSLKAGLLATNGAVLGEQVRCATPSKGGPEQVVAALAELVRRLGPFDRISVGFPGAIRRGVILTAPNLASASWHGVALGERLATVLGKPVRLANDATMQGLGAITGHGLECIVTFGTGMGFALFREGVPAPQIELSRHPIGRYSSYDDFVGNAALVKVGAGPWNRRVLKVIERVKALVNYDTLYLGGGNARLLAIPMPPEISIVSNEAGVTGGIRLWDAAVDGAFI
jgi:polyphosphate glucokinase